MLRYNEIDWQSRKKTMNITFSHTRPMEHSGQHTNMDHFVSNNKNNKNTTRVIESERNWLFFHFWLVKCWNSNEWIKLKIASLYCVNVWIYYIWPIDIHKVCVWQTCFQFSFKIIEIDEKRIFLFFSVTRSNIDDHQYRWCFCFVRYHRLYRLIDIIR